MGINQQSQALMDKIRAKKGVPLFLNTVEAVREANIKQYCTNPPLVEIGKTQDVFVPCPWGMLRIKLYYPKEFMQQDCALLPVVVFYHGGGWTVDTVETHDKAVHVMCASSGCVFASVDYRLAPENRFPAGIEDAYTGLQWIYDNAEKIGVDREKIAVCGDSSGGNFAAVVCQMARDRGGVPIRNQVLIYPNTDFVMAGWKSAETVGSGYYCTKDALLWYWNHYVGDSYDLENPYLCPMRAKSFADLPDAYVVVASYDPLHDEGEAYAKALEAAGVKVKFRDCTDLMHGFILFWDEIDEGYDVLVEIGAYLKDNLKQ